MGPLHHANVCHKHCFGSAQGTFLATAMAEPG